MAGPQRPRASTVTGIETASGNFPGAPPGDDAADVAGTAASPSAVPLGDGDGAQVIDTAATSAPWTAFGEGDPLSAFPPPASSEAASAASPAAASAAAAAVPATSSSPAVAGTPAVSEDDPSASKDERSPADTSSTGAAVASGPDWQATFSDLPQESAAAVADEAFVPAEISAKGADDEKTGEDGPAEAVKSAAAVLSEVTPTGGGGGEMEASYAASAADNNSTPGEQPPTAEAAAGVTDSTGSTEGGPVAEAAGATAVVSDAATHVSVSAHVGAVEAGGASSKEEDDAAGVPVATADASATEQPDELKTSTDQQFDSIPLATAAADATMPVPPSPDASDIASNLSSDPVEETTRQLHVTASSSPPSNEPECVVATAVEESVVDVSPKEVEATSGERDVVDLSTERAAEETDRVVAADEHMDSGSCEKADTAVDEESGMLPDPKCVVEQFSPVVSGSNTTAEVPTEGLAEGGGEQPEIQDGDNTEEEHSPSSMMRPEISRSRSFSNANSEMSVTDTRTPTPRSRLPGAVSRTENAALMGLSGKVLDMVLDTKDSPDQSSSEQAQQAVESTPSPPDAAAGTGGDAVAGETETTEALGPTLDSVDVDISPIAAPEGKKDPLTTEQQVEQHRRQEADAGAEPPQQNSGEPPRHPHEQGQHLAAEATADVPLNPSSSSSSFSSSPSFTAVTPGAVTPSAVAGVAAPSPSGGAQSTREAERPLTHPRLEVVERVVVLAGPETLLAPVEAATAHARAPLLMSNPRFTSIPSLPEHTTADSNAKSTVSLADLWEGGQTTR